MSTHPTETEGEAEKLLRAATLRIAGLEAMLSDANMVIADLREKGRENIRLGRENAELRVRVKALEEMGRPFADIARRLNLDGRAERDGVEIVVSVREMRRAVELIPETKEGE